MTGDDVPQFHLSLGGSTRLERVDGHGLRVLARGQEMNLRAPSSRVVRAVERLTEGGAPEEALCEETMETDPSDLFSLLALLRALDANGVLQRRLVVNGRLLATLTPGVGGFRFRAGAEVPQGRRKLSRFAYLRTDQGVLGVESPLGRARVTLDDPAAATAVVAMARPQTADELDSRVPALAGEGIRGLLVLLENADVLTGADDCEAPDPPGAPSAAWWEFHDLVFHMRSRRGRHDTPYGGTYRFGALTPPPLAKPRPAGAEVIALARPDLESLRATDPPFTEVLERRRSMRAYGPDPVSITQLGEFLYRTVRYQRVLQDDTTDFAMRPAPAGGALHELEVYPVVAHCDGLEPGIYHYRPMDHELTLVAGSSPLVDRLLSEASWTAGHESPLSVYFQITARCQRVFWKYESMAYALILKNLGALYATMYLVASAMELAPCALGGGDSELFASAAGLDPCEEPAVGEFVLGTQPVD